MKGYRIIVGKKKGSGLLNYSKGDIKKAEALGKRMRLGLEQNGLGQNEELSVDIQSVKLKKCDTSYCKNLIEVDEGRMCEKCESIMYDAQMEYAELKREEELYG